MTTVSFFCYMELLYIEVSTVCIELVHLDMPYFSILNTILFYYIKQNDDICFAHNLSNNSKHCLISAAI